MKQRDEMVASLIRHFGSQVKLAEKLNLKQGTITGWLNKKHGISEINALKIEKITDGKFKATDLCPRLVDVMQTKTPSGN